jgi:hypothetical protein
MIEMGKKYQTRDGRAVRILATDMKGGDASVIGLVMGANGTEFPACWRTSGRTLEMGVTISEGDLVPVPTKHEMWVLITDNNPYRDIGPERYPTLAEAVAWCNESKGESVAHVTWVSPSWNGGE